MTFEHKRLINQDFYPISLTPERIGRLTAFEDDFKVERLQHY